MAQVWLVTVPNGKDHPDKTFSSIEKLATPQGYCTMAKVEIPNLVVGTLDSLISLADELNKIGSAVEVCLFICLCPYYGSFFINPHHYSFRQNVVRKVERQYIEISGPKLEPLRVKEATVEGYLQKFQWDFAQYQHQGRQLTDLTNQIQAMASKIDDDLKTLSASYIEKTVSLTALKRKKVVNFSTSDLEDFLLPRDLAKIDALDSDNLLSLLVVVPQSLEQGNTNAI
jgi:V-type H+-transporting ATPase subunit C